MAKHEPILPRGRVGNIILYSWKGISCARTLPSRVKQTKATKQSAKDFGRAVKLSKLLRESLSHALPNYTSREIMYKMNAALLNWLRQQKPIEEDISFVGLEFNDKSPFSARFRKQLVVDFDTKGKVIIKVPRLKIPDDIIAPAHTSSIRLNIAIAGCMLNLSQSTDLASATIKMPSNDSVAAIKEEMKFTCKPGSINVVAVSLHYITKKDGREKEIIDERWTPASIVAAVVK